MSEFISDILENAEYDTQPGDQAILTGDFNVLRRPTSKQFHERITAQSKEFEEPMNYIQNKEYGVLCKTLNKALSSYNVHNLFDLDHPDES